jgi:hypothetical protein
MHFTVLLTLLSTEQPLDHAYHPVPYCWSALLGNTATPTIGVGYTAQQTVQLRLRWPAVGAEEHCLRLLPPGSHHPLQPDPHFKRRPPECPLQESAGPHAHQHESVPAYGHTIGCEHDANTLATERAGSTTHYLYGIITSVCYDRRTNTRHLDKSSAI